MAGGIVAMALALASFDPYLFTGGDNAQYYALTRALATGRGYVDLVTPGTPPYTQYPPGYPALLVPFYILFDGSYVALKLVSMLAAAALLWAAYLVARRDPAVPGWVAAATVWMVGLYEPFQLYAHRVLSDMPFVALAVLALAVLQRAAGEERGDRLDRDWLIGCALALAAFYVRTAAVALLAAIVAWALLRRRWRRAALAAGMFIAFSLPWFLWGRLAGAGGSASGVYIQKLVASSPLRSGPRRGRLDHLLNRLHETGVEYGTFQLPHLFWPTDPAPDIIRVVGCAVGVGLLALGAWRLLRSRRPAPWDIYVAASLGLLVFWPWIGDRYFLALAPFLWIMMLTGLDALSRRLTGRGTIAVGATAALAAALLAAGSVKAIRQWDSTGAWMRGDEFAGYTPFWADYFRAARWIGGNVPSDAVILARKPTLAWYWSGQPAVSPPWAGNPDRAWQRIRGYGVTHILLEPWTERRLRDVLHPRAMYLSVVHETPRREVVVLEVSPASDATPPQ
ncbi:MAG TPA: glycosyltransferase 87 family protein [Longimicrobiaceae bacterium]|nr:glycosyltransferase 87 family protein [Longimicrobiaceae bacterium]